MPPQPEPASLTVAAWVFMTISVAFVTGLVAWCFYRVLTTKLEPPPPVRDFHNA